MAARTLFTAGVLVALCLAVSSAAWSDRHLLAEGTVFDWGRPCTLLGSNSATEITGPNNAACTSCGSGTTATPEPTCTFKSVSYKVGDTISISYHSSVHHLFLGASKCAFTTEVCPNATAEAVSTAKPCTYKFTTPGSFYISDQAGKTPGEYCTDFGASLPVDVTGSS